jgi:hypothetical protein
MDKELMALYGELMVQAEIIQNRIIECKKKIAESMSKKEEPKNG